DSRWSYQPLFAKTEALLGLRQRNSRITRGNRATGLSPDCCRVRVCASTEFRVVLAQQACIAALALNNETLRTEWVRGRVKVIAVSKVRGYSEDYVSCISVLNRIDFNPSSAGERY